MSRTVELLPAAVADLEALVARAGQFSATARTHLLAALANKMRLLEQLPESCPVIPERPHLRRCVVSATISLYYRLTPTAVEIVGIVDTRRNPDALNLPR